MENIIITLITAIFGPIIVSYLTRSKEPKIIIVDRTPEKKPEKKGGSCLKIYILIVIIIGAIVITIKYINEKNNAQSTGRQVTTLSPSLTCSQHLVIKTNDISELIKQCNNGKYLIDLERVADGNWYFVFNYDTLKAKYQAIFYSTTLDKEKISRYQKSGWTINSIDFFQDTWVVVMDARQKRQELLVAPPKETIQEKIASGYFLKDCTFHQEIGYVYILEQDKTAISDDIWDKNFPKNKIKEFWDAGYSIDKCKFVNNYWMVTMKRVQNQAKTTSWRLREQFPINEIFLNEMDKFSALDIAFDGSQWALISEK